MDDTTLVRRAAAGDDKAFAALLGKYHNGVFRLALKILGNRAEAEDVAQEVSVTAWRRISSIQDPAALRTWLFRVAHRQCLGVLKARRPYELTGTIPDFAASHPASDPHRMAEAVAGTRALADALEKLPQPQRLTWLMAEIQSLPHQQIATLTESTEEAVRARLARARVRLALAMRAWR